MRVIDDTQVPTVKIDRNIPMTTKQQTFVRYLSDGTYNRATFCYWWLKEQRMVRAWEHRR